MAYVLGIDGGGTKTLLLLASREGVLLGRSVQEGTNLHDVSVQQAGVMLGRGLRELLEAEGALLEDVAAVAWGAAGVDLPGDQEVYAALLRQLGLRCPITVQNDVIASHRAAFAHGEPGVLLNAGTGSIAYGRYGEKSRRTGGWGDLLGDEGSAYDIGLRGLKAVVKGLDGRGKATVLQQLLPRAAGESRVEDLLHKAMAHQLPRAFIAGLAPAVSQAAAQGDLPAMLVLQQSAVDLAALVRATVEGLGLTAPVWVSLMGGAFKLGPPLMEPFMEMLHKLPFVCQVREPDFPPEVGAVLLALELAGWWHDQSEAALKASHGAVLGEAHTNEHSK